MKVQTALLARYAEVESESGLLNVTGGGLSVFGSDRLPLELPVGFVLQLTFDESEADQEHRLEVEVLGPDLQAVGETIDVPFTPRFGQFHTPGWRGFFAITGSLTLLMEAAGAHSVQIALDGQIAGDIPFLVADSSGPGPHTQ